MCGISAYFDLGRLGIKPPVSDTPPLSENGLAAPVDHLPLRLKRSAESMKHRGPDNAGTWSSLDSSVGLAHVRLATRDLSAAGNQPFHSTSPEADIHVVMNGEIYYDDSLRQALKQEYSFQSTSDSELIIPLYQKYGLDFVHMLRGEFALVIYDGKKDELVLARDRFGVKPLHYAIFNGKLLVATQCKGISAMLEEGQKLRWDVTCIAQGGGHYGHRTLFEGVRKVPQGTIAVVKRGEDEVQFEQYYRTRYAKNEGGKDFRPKEQLVQELRGHLLEAVRLRTDSTDVEVGALLSGGVDSSAVVGMAAHLGKKPTCFTIAFPDDTQLDESSIAARTAADLGLSIEKVVVDEETLASEFDEACWLGETLMWDLQHVAKKALARHISSKGLRVVLNGDGGDEIFGGYPFFVSDRLEEDDLLRAPDLLSTTTADREALRLRRATVTLWFGKETLARGQVDEHAADLRLPPAFSKLAVTTHHASWLKPETKNLSNPFAAIHETFSKTEIQDMESLHPLRRGMLTWSKTLLPNLVVAAISDGAEMVHVLESRPPFLDHVVADFANSLPADLLVHLPDAESVPIEKYILREAVKPFVTPEIYARRKHAFSAPFKWKEGGPLWHKFQQLLTKENLEALGFVDVEKALQVRDRAFRAKDELLFREALWLAQIVSLGKSFGLDPCNARSLFD